jgi:hypothetical protein
MSIDLQPVPCALAQAAAKTPSVTDWMQAWGTVAAAVFSALAFVGTVGLLLHEVRTRRRDEADRIAGQARMVLISVFDAHDNDEGGLVRMVNIHVRNHSASPIIDVDVLAIHRVPEDGSSEPDTLTFQTESIEPGHSDSELWLLRTPIRWAPGTPLAESFNTRIAFTDAEGLRWIREGRAEPRRQLANGSRGS